MTLPALTFGIELEFVLPANGTMYGAANAVNARIGAGRCEQQRYNHNASSAWKIVTDGSINGDGAECVSPVLTGEAGLAEVEKVCEALQDYGCTVNRSCGMHVHVGAANQSAAFFKSLVRLYQTFEPVIDAMMPVSRRASNNTYCRSICGAAPAAIMNASTRADIAQIIYRNSGAMEARYHKLNLDAYTRHSTVEFRQHSGSLDGRKAAYWIKLCLRMVEAAKNGFSVTVRETRAPRNTCAPGSKRHAIVEMIMRPNGATRTEIVAATDWPSVSIAQIAASSGLDILTERTGRETRYRINSVTNSFPAAALQAVTIAGFCAAIRATADEAAYITSRTSNLSGTIEWAA